MEKFVMPFSHDEAVPEKATIVQKMNEEYVETCKELRYNIDVEKIWKIEA